MNYIILFKDRQRLQVEEGTAEKLKTLIRNGVDKTFELADSLYTVSGVDKIVPKQEAYDIFPNDYQQLNSMFTVLPKGNFEQLTK